jgi:hypothetical protein
LIKVGLLNEPVYFVDDIVLQFAGLPSDFISNTFLF